jgi:hypothetical protein
LKKANAPQLGTFSLIIRPFINWSASGTKQPLEGTDHRVSWTGCLRHKPDIARLRVSSLKQWIADDSFIEVELSNVRFTVRRMGAGQ